jgi:hypothetical protein
MPSLCFVDRRRPCQATRLRCAYILALEKKVNIGGPSLHMCDIPMRATAYGTHAWLSLMVRLIGPCDP